MTATALSGREFVTSLMRDVESAMQRNNGVMPPGMDGPELPEPILRHWLNFAVYYEKAATAFIGGWLRTTNEPDALMQLAHQIEDEANHFVWLNKHLLEYGVAASSFTPPKEWAHLMEVFYPGLEHLVERLAAHNIASETGALGFMEYNMTKFPPAIRATVEKVSKDEKFHVAFGRRLLAKYCTTPELQERARRSTQDALNLMSAARRVFVKV